MRTLVGCFFSILVIGGCCFFALLALTKNTFSSLFTASSNSIALFKLLSYISKQDPDLAIEVKISFKRNPSTKHLFYLSLTKERKNVNISTFGSLTYIFKEIAHFLDPTVEVVEVDRDAYLVAITDRNKTKTKPIPLESTIKYLDFVYDPQKKEWIITVNKQRIPPELLEFSRNVHLGIKKLRYSVM